MFISSYIFLSNFLAFLFSGIDEGVLFYLKNNINSYFIIFVDNTNMLKSFGFLKIICILILKLLKI